MTPQEIFDKAATHLLTQNARSTARYDDCVSYSSCAYRGDEGRKCAIGALIPDEEYRKEMEGNTASGLVWELGYRPAWLDTEAKMALARRLQLIHDCKEVPKWSEELRDLARKYDLDAHVLDAHALAERTAEAA